MTGGPAVVAVVARQIVAQFQVDRLEVVGEGEPEAELGGVVMARVRQQVVVEPVVRDHHAAEFVLLPGDRHQGGAEVFELAEDALQS